MGLPSEPQPGIPLSSWLAALPRPCPLCRLPWELGLGCLSSIHQCLPWIVFLTVTGTEGQIPPQF